MTPAEELSLAMVNAWHGCPLGWDVLVFALTTPENLELSE